MIRIDECTDRCDLDSLEKCEGLVKKAVKCDHNCPFYKPVGCSDWVRVDGELIPPEEYERMNGNENHKPKEVYWHVKRVPISKK